MTEPAQPLDLAPIQARVDAATPGDWAANGFTVTGGGAWVADTCDVVDMAHGLADADFIAHARQDVPALITEVLRLRDELAELKMTPRERANAHCRALLAAGDHEGATAYAEAFEASEAHALANPQP